MLPCQIIPSSNALLPPTYHPWLQNETENPRLGRVVHPKSPIPKPLQHLRLVVLFRVSGISSLGAYPHLLLGNDRDGGRQHIQHGCQASGSGPRPGLAFVGPGTQGAGVA